MPCTTSAARSSDSPGVGRGGVPPSSEPPPALACARERQAQLMALPGDGQVQMDTHSFDRAGRPEPRRFASSSVERKKLAELLGQAFGRHGRQDAAQGQQAERKRRQAEVQRHAPSAPGWLPRLTQAVWATTPACRSTPCRGLPPSMLPTRCAWSPRSVRRNPASSPTSIVIDKHPLTMADPEAIANVKVLRTFVGGEVVHQAPAFRTGGSCRQRFRHEWVALGARSSTAVRRCPQRPYPCVDAAGAAAELAGPFADAAASTDWLHRSMERCRRKGRPGRWHFGDESCASSSRTRLTKAAASAPRTVAAACRARTASCSLTAA